MSSRDRAAEAGRDQHSLRVVRRGSRKLIKRERGRRLAPLVILSAIVAIAVVFGVLLEQVVLAQSAFKMTRIRERLAAAESQHQALLLEAAKVESSDRIERFARDELGMVDPAPTDVEYVIADVVGGRRRALASADVPGRAGISDGTAAASERGP